MYLSSLRKQPTFGDATTGFPAKWRLRNKRRNSILMTRHYPDLGSASDWLNQISHAARPIRSTTHIWVVTRHQYGISPLVSQTSFRGVIIDGVAKCRLFSQASIYLRSVFRPLRLELRWKVIPYLQRFSLKLVIEILRCLIWINLWLCLLTEAYDLRYKVLILNNGELT